MNNAHTRTQALQSTPRSPATRDEDATPASVAGPQVVPAPPTREAAAASSTWSAVEPTDKDMGLVRLTLDKGVKTTAIGQLYGLDFEIDGDGFSVRVFFDNYNRRLKVLDYEAKDYRAMADRLIYLADANGYDKIFFKAGREDWQEFLELGFLLEGILKYYYRGEDAYVMSRFSSVDRVMSEHVIEEAQLIESLMKQKAQYEAPSLPSDYQLVACTEEHIPELVGLYRHVFRTYPSPLTHPDYIQQTMRRNVIYRAILDGKGAVVSAASAEIDEKYSNAEVTDCATLPTQRGKGLMYHIVRRLEADLRDLGVQTGYSLARARSQGMNRVFFRLDYEYSGRLINNCDIYGQFEDMNIWVKRLK